MRVSFIGMSNIGKTYWSKRMAAKGLLHINCDALIERKLEPELKALGYHGLRDVAKWMGQPPDPQYKENSARYTACEKQTMREALDNLLNDERQTVIDTTGSVIYTGDDILATLRERTQVVYFEASEEHVADLYRRYVAHPKPTIWGDIFAPQEGETGHETLKRCYPNLLRERARRYGEVAHVTIPFARHRNRTTDIGALIEEYSVS